MKSSKEIMWEAKLAEVNKIADKLGTGVDEKIQESVAAFLAHGFTTDGSCEGHLSHGLPYPWIDVCTPEPEGWRERRQKSKDNAEAVRMEQEWMAQNFGQRWKMLRLLEEFYTGRQTPFDARFIFESIGVFGGFRIQSFGGDSARILSAEQQKEKLALYQKEMADFTAFLKEKYFSVPEAGGNVE